MLRERGQHSGDAGHGRTEPHAEGSGSSREEFCGQDVDEVEGDAGEELTHEVEQVRKPGGVSQERAGKAAKAR